jgi:hypothetical protein
MGRLIRWLASKCVVLLSVQLQYNSPDNARYVFHPSKEHHAKIRLKTKANSSNAQPSTSML